jgi:hypothetical protein
MRLFAVFVAICALSQPAIAQTSECKAITDADTRLACYDRIASPARSSAAAKPAPRAVAATGKADAGKADAGKFVDSISDEDALMNARLKNICRGC